MQGLFCFILAVSLIGLSSCGGKYAESAQICSQGITLDNRTIRNGDTAPNCAYDSIVLIDTELNGGDILCSGVLIRSDVVLTAGHCINGSAGGDSSQVLVRGKGTTQSKSQVLHPQFVDNGYPTLGTDVALIFLSDSIGDVAPVLMSDRIPAIGSQVTAMGYGYDGRGTDGNGGLGKLLQGALQVISYFPNGASQPRAIIAKARTAKSQETCEGDSGSPLLFEDEIVGILSAGDAKSERCVDAINSSYTSIAPLRDWIKTQLEN